MNSPVNLGTRQTFADVAATIAHCFDAPQRFGATSFLNDLMEGK